MSAGGQAFMRAVRLTAVGARLEEELVPVPDPGAGEVLVRVKAAGICHSDAHYRSGTSPVGPLPLTPGHEVAGVVEAVGTGVSAPAAGDRVCLHYLVSCGSCVWCASGNEQFCPQGQMIGKHRDGGYAELVRVPARNAVPIPPELSFEHAAVLMCSSATSLHALRKARLQPGERVAVFGAGGLGVSAVQIARACGALEVYAVDVQADRLRLVEKLGAVAVDASAGDPVERIRAATGGRGVEVAVELIGLPETTRQALACLAPLGRCAVAGIGGQPVAVHTYTEMIGREAELIGVSDHLLGEIPLLLEWARRGILEVGRAVERSVALEAEPINRVLDELQGFRAAIRTVIVP